MTLIIFTVLGNYHHYLFPKLFHYPKEQFCNHSDLLGEGVMKNHYLITP